MYSLSLPLQVGRWPLRCGAGRRRSGQPSQKISRFVLCTAAFMLLVYEKEHVKPFYGWLRVTHIDNYFRMGRKRVFIVMLVCWFSIQHILNWINLKIGSCLIQNNYILISSKVLNIFCIHKYLSNTWFNTSCRKYIIFFKRMSHNLQKADTPVITLFDCFVSRLPF